MGQRLRISQHDARHGRGEPDEHSESYTHPSIVRPQHSAWLLEPAHRAVQRRFHAVSRTGDGGSFDCLCPNHCRDAAAIR
jgi:hypothetical protein